jgi:DNA-binding transcriptional ArsR family regulator
MAERRSVLYIALEDNARRIQDRISKIGVERGNYLTFALAWRSGADGIFDLGSYLNAHPETNVVIIDTLARFSSGERGSNYKAEYHQVASIKKLADRHECAIILVHHVRKSKSKDLMNEVVGTNGVNGAADATWILSRSRGQSEASLYITGRDVEEQTLPLRFDEAMWILSEAKSEDQMSPERRAIYDLLAEGKLSPKEIAERLGKNHNTTRVLLMKMKENGIIVVDEEGYYSIPKEEDPEIVNSVNGEEAE